MITTKRCFRWYVPFYQHTGRSSQLVVDMVLLALREGDAGSFAIGDGTGRIGSRRGLIAQISACISEPSN